MRLPMSLRDAARQDTLLERGSQWSQRLLQETPERWTSNTN